jgi:S1-C subfamily serine protease
LALACLLLAVGAGCSGNGLPPGHKLVRRKKTAVGLAAKGIERSASARDQNSLIGAVRSATVVIQDREQSTESQALGSGFFVSSGGDVITNRHVMIALSDPVVKTLDGSVYPVTRVLAYNKTSDIMKLAVNTGGRQVSFLETDEAMPLVGEDVVVVGAPLGLQQTVSKGNVSSIRDWPEDPGRGKVIQFTAPVSPGSSGGPVVNMKGRVIGAVSFQAPSYLSQNLNFAIPVGRLNGFALDESPVFAKWRSRESDGYMGGP